MKTPRTFGRRRFLRGAGVAVALPVLDALCPSLARAAGGAVPRRFLAICNNLGLLPDKFFPTQAGRGYALSPYLEVLKEHRQDFTVLSGLSHPGVDGGHYADNCFLTAAPHPGRASFRNTVSLDQVAAQHLGAVTRFPTLTLGVNANGRQRSLSWTANGVLIPCEDDPGRVFRRLFLDGSPAEIRAQLRRLETGRSVLDAVSDQARALGGDVGARDRGRLEQYLAAIRDLELRLAGERKWQGVPKPRPRSVIPADPMSPQDYMRKTRLMYDLARLAFETDSTRLVTLMLDSANSPAIEVEGAEIRDDYHSLSHHGKDPSKRAQLEAIDREHMRLFGGLLAGLKEVREDGAPLLDRTLVLYGSNLGDANTHATSNLPLLLAGGGFRHGGHLAFDREHNYPLPNLFVSVLQRMGLKADRFAGSTGTLPGLEWI